MYTSDYKKELQLSSEKPVPAIIAVLLVAILGASIWIGYSLLKPHYMVTQPAAAMASTSSISR